MALTSRQISCEEISATTALRLSECRPHAASWPLRIAFRPAALTIHRISDAASALPAEPPSTSSSSRKPPRRSSAPIDFLPRRFFWSGATVTAASFNLFSLLVSRIRILVLAFAGIELNLVPPSSFPRPVSSPSAPHPAVLQLARPTPTHVPAWSCEACAYQEASRKRRVSGR